MLLLVKARNFQANELGQLDEEEPVWFSMSDCFTWKCLPYIPYMSSLG